MLLFNKIESLRKENNITQKELVSKIGKTREWYTKMIKRKNIMTGDLIALAELFKVPVKYFFEEEEELSTSVNEIQEKYIKKDRENTEIKLLKDQVKILDEQVKQKDGQINFLQKQIENSTG